MKLKRMIYAVLGCLCLGLGTLGAFLPVLPTVPFLLLTGFFFARSSERLDTWFKGTKIYKENLETYVKGEGMTKHTKRHIMGMITLTLGISLIITWNMIVVRSILIIVWICLMIYFSFVVKTITESKQLKEI